MALLLVSAIAAARLCSSYVIACHQVPFHSQQCDDARTLKTARQAQLGLFAFLALLLLTPAFASSFLSCPFLSLLLLLPFLSVVLPCISASLVSPFQQGLLLFHAPPIDLLH